MSSAMESLDTLIDAFRHALSLDDWEALNRVNESVEPTVEAAAAEVRRGEIESGMLSERLADLRSLMDEAEKSAETSRNSAARELRGINQNRSAVNAYANVRSRGGRT